MKPTPTSRRDFLKTSSTVALGGALAFPSITKAAGAGDKLRIGFIGCGGRGSGAAAQALKADSNVELYAVGDVFQSQIDKSLKAVQADVAKPEKFNVPAERQFVGIDSYQKVINSGVDMVILTTPPGFRPQHLRAAVEAGKHVFLEKPMATDAPGIRSVIESVKIAKEKKLAMVAGFCWRYDASLRELFKRIHDGQIGEIRAVYANYLTGPVKPMPPADTRPAGITDMEWMIRNWYNFNWLSGDGLVEQAVHAVDWVGWVMKDQAPLRCTAVGGRQIPAEGGNIYDHIEVNFEWEGGVRGFLAQRQITGCYGENNLYAIGSKGVASIGRQRSVRITGDNPWRYEGEKPADMYQVEHDELFASIRAGNPINDGDRMVTSTLMAIMGRTAGYTGLEITWDMMLNSKQVLVPDIKDWNTPIEVPPLAMPGRTKFI
ncbi:MAG: oxidoreductase domain protein [Verrucomicrobia bacterium]|jgi:predicted dehydrogenase|nr:oxidoreductase domain protein [Verrucomicrobiota bacterium]